MSFGDGDLHVQVAQLKTENARMKQRNGELESLVRDLWEGFECDRCPLYGDDCWWKQGDELKPCRMMNRMRGLGIEVG